MKRRLEEEEAVGKKEVVAEGKEKEGEHVKEGVKEEEKEENIKDKKESEHANENKKDDIKSSPEKKKAKTTVNEEQSKLKLISLENLDEKGIKELAAVAADPVVMKFIGNSKPWDEGKIRELVDGAIGDKDIPAHKREYFSWAVANGDDDGSDVIGLVALRPTKDRRFPGLQFRVFVKNNVQKKGVGSETLKIMFNEYKRRLDESFGDGKERRYKMFAFSRMDNEAASRCFKRCGMNNVGTKRFGREVENAWEITL